MLITLILQIIGTAQVFLEPYLFTGGGPDNATADDAAADLRLRVRQQPRRRLRRGDRAEPDARRASLAVLSLVYFRLTRSWSASDATWSSRPRRRGPSSARRRGPGPPRRRPPASRASATDERRAGITVGVASADAPLARSAASAGCTRSARCSWSSSALGPMLWLAKSAITPTQDTLRTRWRCGPNGIDWANLRDRLGRRPHRPVLPQHDRHRRRARGPCQMLVATTGGYVLSVLRPRYGRVLHGAGAGHAVRAGRRAARAALPDRPGPAVRAPSAGQQLLGRRGCRPARARSTSCW